LAYFTGLFAAEMLQKVASNLLILLDVHRRTAA